MTTVHTHTVINTSRFHVSQHTITVIHYLLRDDTKQSIINKRIENSTAPALETLDWFCVASLQGASQGCFFPPCLSNRINEQVEQLVIFAWLGRDHLNSLNSQSLNSLQVVKNSDKVFWRPSPCWLLHWKLLQVLQNESVMTSKPCNFHTRLFLLIFSLEIILLFIKCWSIALSIASALQRKKPNAREWEVLAEMKGFNYGKKTRKVMLHWLEMPMNTTTWW